MTRSYPTDARSYLSGIDTVSKEIAAAVIGWSHEPHLAPTQPRLWCPVLDSKLADADEKDNHDAEDCEYCPDTLPRVRTAKVGHSKPVEKATVAAHAVIEQIVDAFDEQLEWMVAHRHKICADDWWPSRIRGKHRQRGTAATTFDHQIVQARNDLLAAAGDIVGHVERVDAKCNIDRRRRPDQWDGWADDNLRHHVVALGDCLHELRRVARRWHIDAKPHRDNRPRCTGCHRIAVYRGPDRCRPCYKRERRQEAS